MHLLSLLADHAYRAKRIPRCLKLHYYGLEDDRRYLRASHTCLPAGLELWEPKSDETDVLLNPLDLTKVLCDTYQKLILGPWHRPWMRKDAELPGSAEHIMHSDRKKYPIFLVEDVQIGDAMCLTWEHFAPLLGSSKRWDEVFCVADYWFHMYSGTCLQVFDLDAFSAVFPEIELDDEPTVGTVIGKICFE